jgi:hypothetical protein
MTLGSESVPSIVRVLVLIGWCWIGALAGVLITIGFSNRGVLRTESLLAAAVLACVLVLIVYRNWRVVLRGTPSAQIRPPYGPHVVRGVSISVVLLILLTLWLLRHEV